MSPLIVGVVRRGLRDKATSVTSRWRTDTSFAVACLILMLTTPVRAQAPDTVFLEELTWTELRTLVESGKTTIILPIGGTEQNGPHMALGKHNVRVKALSERIARTLGNALVAPVIAYVPEGTLSPPTGHMRFPGTITETACDPSAGLVCPRARTRRQVDRKSTRLNSSHGYISYAVFCLK